MESTENNPQTYNKQTMNTNADDYCKITNTHKKHLLTIRFFLDVQIEISTKKIQR